VRPAHRLHEPTPPWSPAFTAKEPYLKGSYSGRIAFQASLSRPRRYPSRACHTASAAREFCVHQALMQNERLDPVPDARPCSRESSPDTAISSACPAHGRLRPLRSPPGRRMQPHDSRHPRPSTLARCRRHRLQPAYCRSPDLTSPATSATVHYRICTVAAMLGSARRRCIPRPPADRVPAGQEPTRYFSAMV
jgi:hypothetical protein